MNEVRENEVELPRILARVVAKETTVQELDENLGSARPTWTLRFPPDSD